MVRVVLDNIILDRTALRTPFGARFHVYVCHVRSSWAARGFTPRSSVRLNAVAARPDLE
jgi:hypothetical protein